MKMVQRVKDLWVKALRSGDYEQGKGALKGLNGYCCLGVLCDLHSAETGTDWDRGVYLGRGNVLPEVVREWAGLSDEWGSRIDMDDRDQGALTTHNDEGGTFNEIATAIDQQL